MTDQLKETRRMLKELRIKEEEARLRALETESKSLNEQKRLREIAQEMHLLWSSTAVEELSSEARSAVVVEHAKRVTSQQSSVHTRVETYELQWQQAWQLRCEALRTLAHVPQQASSWSDLLESLETLPVKDVRMAVGEPTAFSERVELAQQSKARFQVEAAVAADLSGDAARDRALLMGRMDVGRLRRMLHNSGATLDQALSLLLDKDMSELRTIARKPATLASHACAVLHPAAVLTFEVHFSHPPNAFHGPLYRRDLAKFLGMADQQIRIEQPQAGLHAGPPSPLPTHVAISHLCDSPQRIRCTSRAPPARAAPCALMRQAQVAERGSHCRWWAHSVSACARLLCSQVARSSSRSR